MTIKEKIEKQIEELTEFEERGAITMGIVPKIEVTQVIDMLAELLKEE